MKLIDLYESYLLRDARFPWEKFPPADRDKSVTGGNIPSGAKGTTSADWGVDNVDRFDLVNTVIDELHQIEINLYDIANDGAIGRLSADEEDEFRDEIARSVDKIDNTLSGKNNLSPALKSIKSYIDEFDASGEFRGYVDLEKIRELLDDVIEEKRGR